MKIGEMVEEIARQAEAEGGVKFLTPAGVSEAAPVAEALGSDPNWQPKPFPEGWRLFPDDEEANAGPVAPPGPTAPGDREPFSPPAVAAPSWQPPGADPQWRPAPRADGSLFQDPDFSLPTAAGPCSWRLFYDTNNAAQDSEWGFGRRASFPLRLNTDGTTVTVMHDDGSARQYRKVGATFQVVGTKNGDSLVQNGDGSWDETYGATGFRYHFPAGSFVSIAYRATPEDMRLTYNYAANQRLSSVLEPAGRRVTLAYNADGKVQTIEDWGNRGLVVLTYVGGDLTEQWGQTGCLTRYRYDTTHRMTSITDPEGFTTSYTYDYAGRILTRSVAGNMDRYTYLRDGPTLMTGYTDPLGRTWTHLTSGGYPTGEIDPLGNRETYIYQNDRPAAFINALGYATSFSWDSNGFLAGQQDAVGNRWSYTWDSFGNMLTAQDPLGYVTTHSYGANPSLRQLESVINPLGYRTTYGYLPNGLPQFEQDALGNRTTNVWSSLGLLVAIIDPLGYRRTMQYDSVGNRTAETDPLGDTWTYSHDALGREIAVLNPLGFRRSTLYDARGLVQARIDELGFRTSYQWNAHGGQTVSIDELGFRTTTVYDAANQVTATVDALGAITTMNYDRVRRSETLIDALGFRTTTVYDAAGRTVAQIDALGFRWTALFDAAGHAIASVNPVGFRSSVQFDSRGLIAGQIDALGFRITFTHDALGRQIASQDARGYVTTRVFDPLGHRIAEIDGLGFRRSSVFDAVGQGIATVDALGCRFTRSYDGAGQTIGEQDALGFRSTTVYDRAGRPIIHMDELGYVETRNYDPAGRPVADTDPLGNRFTNVFDPRSNLLASINALGFATTMVYDALGRTTAIVDPLGRCRTTVYDVVGQTIGLVDGGGFRTTTAYDGVGRTKSVVNPRGFVASFYYDPAGRLTSSESALGYRTSVVHDAKGQRVVAIDAKGSRTTMAYDATGNLASCMDALGRVRTWNHDAVGQVINSVDPKAQIATMSYSPRREQTGAIYRDGTRLTFIYDARNSLIEARDRSGITTQTWDARGKLATLLAPSHPGGAPLTWGFDPRGRRTQMAFVSGRHTWIYDAVNRNTVYLDPATGRTTWLFDPADGLIEQQYPNGVITTWTYDIRGLVSGIQHRSAGGSAYGADLYRYDPNGNTINKNTLNGLNTWTYDARDHLASEAHDLGLVTTWSYDPVGNRLQQDRTQVGVRTVTNYAYDMASQVTRITVGAAVTTVLFDANGNQVGEETATGRVSYLWDARDLLIGYVGTDAKVATFMHRYDELRARIDPGDGSAATELVWDPMGTSGDTNLLAEVTASGTLQRQYWRGTRLVGYKEPALTGVYLLDHLGSTEQILDTAGVLRAAYRTSAWGEALVTTGTLTGQRFQYGGEWGAYRDILSSDLWMRARLMKPGSGRFLSEDSFVNDPLQSGAAWVDLDPLGLIARDANPYQYVVNNPVGLVDPEGTSPAIGPGVVVVGGLVVAAHIALHIIIEKHRRERECAIICDIASKRPDLNDGDGGTVICAGAMKCPCIFNFSKEIDFERDDGTVEKIQLNYILNECKWLDYCGKKHEEGHMPSVRCRGHRFLLHPAKFPISDKWPEERQERARARRTRIECALSAAEIICVQRQPDTASQHCKEQADKLIKVQITKMRKLGCAQVRIHERRVDCPPKSPSVI